MLRAICRKGIPEGIIYGGYVAALVLSLVPLLRLSFYAVPWYDDYSYGIPLHVLFSVNPQAGIRDILKTVFESIRVEWWAWQGTFSSIFFMSFSPIVFGEQYYFLGVLCLILILMMSTVFLIYTVCVMIFDSKKVSGFAMGIGGAVVLLNTIHTSQAGFYWYNAGVHYVGMHSILFIWTAFLIWTLKSDKKVVRLIGVIASTFLSIVPAGANFVTALQGLVVIVAAFAYALCDEKIKGIRLMPALLIYIVGFYKNVSAPGNSVRAISYVGWGYSPLKAVLLSFSEGFAHIWIFTGFVGVAFILFLIPAVVLVVKNTVFEYRCPLVPAVFSYCLYCTGFTPSLYSLGHAGLGRTLNAVKFTFWILLIFNIIYIAGFIVRKAEARNREIVFPQLGNTIAYAVILAVFSGLVFFTSNNKAGTIAGFGAYYYIHSGEAYNFKEQYLERVSELKSDAKDIVFEPYRFTPWMICAGELSEDPEAEENRLVEEWYKKDSVRIKNGTEQ